MTQPERAIVSFNAVEISYVVVLLTTVVLLTIVEVLSIEDCVT
jgi:hypothetical protein